jgi:hypothetical protein
MTGKQLQSTGMILLSGPTNGVVVLVAVAMSVADVVSGNVVEAVSLVVAESAVVSLVVAALLVAVTSEIAVEVVSIAIVALVVDDVLVVFSGLVGEGTECNGTSATLLDLDLPDFESFLDLDDVSSTIVALVVDDVVVVVVVVSGLVGGGTE